MCILSSELGVRSEQVGNKWGQFEQRSGFELRRKIENLIAAFALCERHGISAETFIQAYRKPHKKNRECGDDWQ